MHEWHYSSALYSVWHTHIYTVVSSISGKCGTYISERLFLCHLHLFQPESTNSSTGNRQILLNVWPLCRWWGWQKWVYELSELCLIEGGNKSTSPGSQWASLSILEPPNRQTWIIFCSCLLCHIKFLVLVKRVMSNFGDPVVSKGVPVIINWYYLNSLFSDGGYDVALLASTKYTWHCSINVFYTAESWKKICEELQERQTTYK